MSVVADCIAEVRIEVADVPAGREIVIRGWSEGDEIGEMVLQAGPATIAVHAAELVDDDDGGDTLSQMPRPTDMGPVWGSGGGKAPDPFKAVADMLRTSQQTNLALQRLLAETSLEGRSHLRRHVDQLLAQVSSLERQRYEAQEERDEIRGAMVAESLAADSIAQEEAQKREAFTMLKDMALPALSKKMGFPLPFTTVHRMMQIVGSLSPEARAEFEQQITPADVAQWAPTINAHRAAPKSDDDDKQAAE
jgi:hypothetical protein